ncbi:hypothetical protein ISF_03963 [Cordyceps fumosorosea ARSEF 2679]|uniref:Uncharacterized protein n=1 Tax=Cordyceps fumosorosea (strain ARSEF 2679) TaxID=1081104 RepID=A0A167YBN4_CORFA|nr:hypothetical protein ISF_03963 [Cordyceps fumosorosea ARSEF 2679]OAA66125.1 hypothetical protein ISF_03963 [Cordyceps fumosorosea ARSEF 2679]
MDRLPQEIVDRIAALLPAGAIPMPEPPAPRHASKPGMLQRLASKVRREHHHPAPSRHWTRASAAATSRRWQRAVEPLVYAALVLRGGDPALERLRAALARRPERCAHIRSLTVVLPLTHRHWTGRGVDAEALLRPLFSVLCEVRTTATVDLTLRFEAGHPGMRHRCRQGIVFDGDEPAVAVAGCVRRLDFTPAAPETERGRRDVLQLHLAEQARLVLEAARFPNLCAVVWHAVESEAQAERDAARDAFAACLAENLPRHRGVTEVSVALRLGRLGFTVCAASGVGAASYGQLLQTLAAATHVEELRYAGVVAPALLDNGRWQALRRLTVCMALLDPEGRFYFAGDVYADAELDTPPGWCPLAPWDRDDERFREVPDEEVMAPLLRALAGLLERLPRLETARLVVRRGTLGAPPWEVCYCAPGRTDKGAWVPADGGDGDGDGDGDGRPSVWFVTGRWRPGDELVREFRRAGRGAGHGEEASVMYWSMEDSPVRL